MQNKPALLSGTDSKRLGLITIKSDEIFSLCKAVKPAKGILPDDLPGYKLHPNMITRPNPPDRDHYQQQTQPAVMQPLPCANPHHYPQNPLQYLQPGIYHHQANWETIGKNILTILMVSGA